MNGQTRSPRYPSMSLEHSIEDIAKIHKSERSNPMDREVAAKALGYSGISGRSATVLANLIQYGLLEKAGKNEVRVSKRAVDIIHPSDDASRAAALQAAASEPELFQKVMARFTDGLPSDNALHSFLVREGYTDAAIPAAIKAFRETWEFLENAIESGSNVPGDMDVLESQSDQQVERKPQMMGGHQTPGVGVNAGRLAELLKPGATLGADVRFVNDVIVLGGAIGSQAQADRLINLITALRPMLRSDDAKSSDDTGSGDPE